MELLRKIYLAIIIFAVIGIAYTFATSKNLYLSSGTFSPPASSNSEISISVSKMNVHYGDMEAWNAKGLPPGADYVAKVNFASLALRVGSGRANANGEANGSFGIGDNIPLGPVTLRIELASDPAIFGEAPMNIES